MDLTTFFVVSGAFFIAGSVKGVIGLGLPTVSLGLLTVALDLRTAMARVEAEVQSPEVDYLLAFLRAPSRRGLAHGPARGTIAPPDDE